jgi:hypothetical protein
MLFLRIGSTFYSLQQRFGMVLKKNRDLEYHKKKGTRFSKKYQENCSFFGS